MPSLDYIEKLTGIKEEWIQNLKETESALVLAVQLPPQEHICPHCKAATRRVKGYYTRLIKHSPLLHKELHLLYRQRRYICSCGHTFNEKSPFASPYFQTSSSLQQVMLQELRQHLSFQEVARRCHVTTSQVIRVFNEVHIPRPSHLPRVLSIDEFKGNAAGQKYQVIITDSENKRIMDILPARTTPVLLQYFYQFPMSERRKVEFVTMDMSMQFRSVIKTIFPKARIVADRFHMIRLVQWAMERVRKAEQKRLCHHSRMFKSNKTILTKPYEKLTEEELIKLEGILRCSPRLRCAYALKYAFSKVLRFKDHTNISWALSAWIDLVKSADLPEMNSLVKSFTYWYEEIRSALIYPYSNGFTEGCNNKIKVLKRISFGLRNFERFRNRILYINTRNEKGHALSSVHVLSRSA